jgi:hypothetical protein
MNNTGGVLESIALLQTLNNVDESLLLKNIVVLIGIAGVGTSTITQFLAGNPKFSAIEKSKTFSPELVPLPNTDTVFADCPGFSDPRGAYHDISAAVCTKILLDNLKKVKILVVTAYNSVRTDGEPKGFTDLLVHLVQFIKYIDKYNGSIGLIVTKVDNPTTESVDGQLQYIDDKALINEIGTFLNEVKIEIMKKPQDDFVARQVQILDIFMAKDENEYSKIGIFRTPTKIGKLDSGTSLTNNSDAIEIIMNTALNFTSVTPDDFGMSLSAESKTLVFKLRGTLNTRLSNILDDYIRVYSKNSRQYAALNLENTKIGFSRSINVFKFLRSATIPRMVVSNLMDRIETLDPDGNPADKNTEWKKKREYLQFFESIAPTNRDIGDFEKYRSRLVIFRNRVLDNMKFMAQNAEDIIDTAIGEVISEVMMAVKNATVNLDQSSQLSYAELSEQIGNVYALFEKLKENHQNKPNLSFREFFDGFKASFNVSNIQKEKLEYSQTNIDFFMDKANVTITEGHQEIWLQGFAEAFNDIKKEADWLSFLTDSYTKLIEYDNQNVIANTHRNLRNWTDFKVFSKELGPNKALHSYLESRLTLTAKEQTDLGNLIDATNPTLVHSCESSKLIVEGTVIKLSEVKTNLIPKCPSFTELYIFASQTVFIDGSLTEPMKNVYIIAPTWSVKGKERLINLRGLDANPKGQTPAGEPGQPGGNFIGVGDKFVNEKELTIDVSGGNGGNGEDGANGQDGQEGLTPSTPRKTIWYKVRSHELLAPMLDSHDFCEHRIKYEDIAGFANEGGGRFKMFGTKGTPGSPGRNGGKPGYGAQPGIILMESNSSIKKFAFPGKNGAEGSGGRGGRGGKHGEARSILCNTITHNTLFKFEYISDSLENQGHAGNGSSGASGVTGNLVKAAQPQSFVPLSKVAEQYKDYVQRKKFRFVDSVGFIDRHISIGNRKRRSISTPSVVDNVNWAPQYLAVGSENFKTRTWPSEFSLSSFMTLADVLIRKLLKIKPITVESQADITWKNHLLQAEVHEMVKKCEAKWKGQSQQDPFDI